MKVVLNSVRLPGISLLIQSIDYLISDYNFVIGVVDPTVSIEDLLEKPPKKIICPFFREETFFNDNCVITHGGTSRDLWPEINDRELF